MMCCGKDRKSRFCPDCGSALKANGLWAAVGYMRQNARVRSRAAEISIKKAEAHPDSAEYHAKTADLARQNAAKWNDWADQLTELLEGK